jgi:hypothetical protein
VEKNRSRDSSNRMLVRSSISMRISLNSCSVKLTGPPLRSIVVQLLFRSLRGPSQLAAPVPFG